MIPVKICGLTRLEDARLAWEGGASALGFVFHPASPRAVTAKHVRAMRRALPPEAFCIGVFVDLEAARVNAIAAEAELDAVQLHGHETPETCAAILRPVIKAIHAEDAVRLADYAVAAFLLDAAHPTLAGGTGRQADWHLAARIAQDRPLILAGGLNPDNILEATARVRPAGLDVCSGVEAAPGIKDAVLLKALLARATQQGERPCLLPH
jgi:phosphoribosylanthranilate isomerase